MQARCSTPSSLAAHHRRLMASCAESGCPQVRQRSDAKLSAPTVGESLCMSKSVEAYYKGQIVSARDLPTGCQQRCSLVVPTVRATTSDRTERQVTSEAGDEATGTRRSTRSASTRISLPREMLRDHPLRASRMVAASAAVWIGILVVQSGPSHLEVPQAVLGEVA
jgi:hypothetical protein